MTSRVIVADDGHDISVVTYAGADALARACLDPLAALHVGADLIQAAQRHLTRAAPPDLRSVGAPIRGGDPHARRRRERDAALREAAQVLAPGQPPEVQARIIVGRLSRYRRMPDETAADRIVLDRIKASGLEPPGVDRTAKIIRAGEQKPDWLPMDGD